MSVNCYLGSRLSLIRSFLSGLLGSTATCLSSISRVPFSLLSAFLSADAEVEVDAIFVHFDAGGIHGELSIDGLDADILLGLLLSLTLAALVAYS
jgi:hypothetical protein